MYTIDLKNLPNNVCGIYKIDFPNGKSYIGKSNNIKRRFYEHNRQDRENIVCDKAIHKYFGKVKVITILEECEQLKLNEREQYWIAYYSTYNKNKGYNLTPGGEHNIINSVFNESQVLDIRKRRWNGERKIKVYQDYLNFNFNTFEKIWLGITWPQIGKEYIIESNLKTRQEYSSKANRGENNNKAKLKETDVLLIRKRYLNGETITQIHKDYNYVSRETIKRVCLRQTWKHLE